MRRGELYLVSKSPDTRLAASQRAAPKALRVFAVVSRQLLLDSRFSTVICAPVFTSGQALSTQVPVGAEEGLKHASWIMCDNLVSLRKSDLTRFVGSLSRGKIAQLDDALRAALALD